MAADSEKEITREEIRDYIQKFVPNAPSDRKQLIEEALCNIHLHHQSAADAVGFSPEEIEIIYRDGYTKFQGGKYDEAIEHFTMLRDLFPEEYRYSFAIGAALQYKKQYQEAAGYYVYCSYLEPLNPIPRFHQYDCFMKLNEPEAAYWSIKECVFLAGLDPKYAVMKEKAILEEKYLADYVFAVMQEREKEEEKVSAEVTDQGENR